MAQSPFQDDQSRHSGGGQLDHGKPFTQKIDTGVTLVTKDNADQFKDAWQ